MRPQHDSKLSDYGETLACVAVVLAANPLLLLAVNPLVWIAVIVVWLVFG